MARCARVARFVELAEPQQSAADGVIGPAAMADDALARLPLEQRLGFLDAVRRVARLADLRHRPGRGGNRPGQMDGDIAGAQHRQPLLDQRQRFRPIALEQMRHGGGEMRPADAEGMLRRLGDADRLGLVFRGFRKRPSSARLITSQARSKIDAGTAMPKWLLIASAGSTPRLSVASATTRS